MAKFNIGDRVRIDFNDFHVRGEIIGISDLSRAKYIIELDKALSYCPYNNETSQTKHYQINMNIIAWGEMASCYMTLEEKPLVIAGSPVLSGEHGISFEHKTVYMNFDTIRLSWEEIDKLQKLRK